MDSSVFRKPNQLMVLCPPVYVYNVVRLQQWNECFCLIFCLLAMTWHLTLDYEQWCSPDICRRFVLLFYC